MTMLIARLLLGGLFAVAAVAKLADRGGVKHAVTAFGVPNVVAAPLGWAMVVAELGTSVLLLPAPTAPAGALMALILLAGFSAAVVLNLIRGRRPECHCFGRLSAGPLGWSTVARNGCLASVAVFVATGGRYSWPLFTFAVVMFGLWLGPVAYRQWQMRAGAGAADLALGTTPLVQKAKSLGIPALYFTNMVSARPLFGPAGAGSMAAIVAAQTKGRERFSRMVSFFEGVGTPDAAGYGWKDVPKDPPGFKERYRKVREAKAKAAQAVGN